MGIRNFFKNKEVAPQTKSTKYQIETSTYTSSYYDKSMIVPYNPDELVSKKGLEVFEKMEIDDQVRASFLLKKLMIISRNWNIEPIDDNPQSKEQADFIYYCFTDGYIGVFKDFLHGLLSALQYGFSVTEKTYKIFDTGRYAGKIGIKSLKDRPPHSFEFNTDDYGNLKELIQHQPEEDKSLDINKFIIYSYDTKFGNFYGRSDFRSAYRSWFSKDIIIRFWNMYLERNGMPTAIGKYKKGTSKPERTNLYNFLKNLSAKSIATIPEDFNVEFLEAKNGAIHYETAIKVHNTMIARSFLIPELIGFTDHETGSQSLGKEQFDLWYKILEDIQTNIEDIINEYQIKELIDYNFPNVTEYPKFKFKDIDTRDKANLYKIWYEAVKTGAVLTTKEDEDYLRNEIGLPERLEDNTNIMPINKPSPNPFNPSGEEKPEDEPKPGIPGKIPEDEDIEKKKFAEQNYNRSLTKYEENINLNEIVNDYEELGLKFAKDLGIVINDIENNMLFKIKRKKIVEKKDFKAIHDISINDTDMRRLASAFLGNNKRIYKQAKATSIVDIKKNVKLVEMDTTGALIPAEAIEYLTSKSINLTGTESAFIKKGVNDILFSGLKNGKTESEIMFELSNFFDNYTVMQKTGAGALLPIEDITGRINTVVRTNLGDAYNMGRVASYNDPNVSDWIPALQYSAILDDRTTDFCLKYDQKIYDKNDPIWDSIIPPNHFNCRSITVPIFQGDEFKTDKRLAIQQPQQFGGQPS